MFRVFCMALMNAIPTAVTAFGATFATNAGYGVGLTTTNYLWISVSGNIVAVILIPFVGNLTDKIGRRPVIIVGCLGSGLLAFPYLYFVGRGQPRDGVPLRHPDVGRVYQGYNAVFPSFFQELFPTKTRVTGVRRLAEPRHPGHRLPAGDLRGAGRPDPGCLRRRTRSSQPDVDLPVGRDLPGSWPTRSRSSVVWTVGSITFGSGHHRGHRRLHRPGDVPDPHERPRQQGRGAGAEGGVRPHPQDRGGRPGLTLTPHVAVSSLAQAAGRPPSTGRSALSPVRSHLVKHRSLERKRWTNDVNHRAQRTQPEPLGTRKPEVYGRTTLADVEVLCREEAGKLGLELEVPAVQLRGPADRLDPRARPARSSPASRSARSTTPARTPTTRTRSGTRSRPRSCR